MPASADLAPEDQARLTAALDHLMVDGLLWRECEPDLRAYNALTRWRDIASAQLNAKGWRLIHHEHTGAFQIIHPKGKHHRQLKRDTAVCLLIARLVYTETPATLTPYPVVTLAALQRRCADFSFDLNLSEALPELESLKLIRAAGGKSIRPTDLDQLVELLPTLEFVVPDSAIETVYRQLTADI